MLKISIFSHSSAYLDKEMCPNAEQKRRNQTLVDLDLKSKLKVWEGVRSKFKQPKRLFVPWEWWNRLVDHRCTAGALQIGRPVDVHGPSHG